MRAFFAFMRKEFTESVRTYKFAIMIAVFVLLGIMSPLLAKMTPEILEMSGLDLALPEPSAMDSWAQFFSNVGQMGMLCLIIVFSGIMANEFSRDTLVNLLTKGLKRSTVIFAKFTAASVLWTLSYLISLGVTLAYTAYFWDIDIQNALLAFGSFWLFGELLIALLIFGGVLFKTFYGSLALAGGMIIALALVSIAPQAAKYNPLTLCGGNLALLNSSQGVEDFIPAVIITAVATAVLIAASVVAFKRKRV